MTIAFKHRFTSTRQDSNNPDLIKGSHWNDGHDLLMDTGKLLGRASNNPGAVEEVAPDNGHIELVKVADTPTLRLKDSGATAGSYTNPNVTVDAKGRVTSISTGPSPTAAAAAAIAAQAAAEAAQAAAEAALDGFDDIYLGSKASDPTTDNDGDPLQEGMMYWNSVNDELNLYDGSAWQPISGGGGGGLSAVVDDTSPQLGGDLDLNGFVITGLEKDTDGALAANSDARIASQKAVKTYADAILTTANAYADTLVAAQDAMVFKGVIDCSANPNYPAADRGWTYRVSVAGKIGGASGPSVEAGDLLLCLTDGMSSGNHATVGAQWAIAQVNLDGAVIGPASVTDSHFAQFDGTSGKLIKGGLALDTDGTLAANSATRIPSQSAVKTYADTKIAGPASVTDENPAVFDGTTGKLAKQLTYTQFLAKLGAFTGDSGSGGVKGLVPAPASGDAAAAKFLNAGGAWSVPSGGGLTLLNSGTVSSAATLDIVLTSYTAYRGFRLIFWNFVPATSNVDLMFRTSTNGGSSYDAGASDYKYGAAQTASNGATSFAGVGATTTHIRLANGIANTAADGSSGAIDFGDQTNTSGKLKVWWQCSTQIVTSSLQIGMHGNGQRDAAGDVDAVRLLMSSGNIASGKWALYGYT